MLKNITQKEFDSIIQSAEGNIDVKKLLEDNGFSPNLNGIKINVPSGEREIAFTGLAIKSCSLNYSPPFPNKMDFDGSIIEDCDFGLIPDFLVLQEANVKDCHGITSLKASALNGAKQSSGFTIIQEQFLQRELLQSHSSILDQKGVCQGLVIEYGRLIEKYGESSLKTDKGPLEKFRRKVEAEKGSKFANRVQNYFTSLQCMSDSEPLDNLITNPAVNTIAIDIRGFGHAMEISKLKNSNGSIKGYRIYDPNLGETTLLENKEKLKASLKNFQNFYSSIAGIEVKIQYHNLTKLVRSLNLVNEKDFSLVRSAIVANDKESIIKLISGMDMSDDFYGRKVISIATTDPKVTDKTILMILDHSNFPLERMVSICSDIYNPRISNKLLDGLVERGLKFTFSDCVAMHKSLRTSEQDIDKSSLLAITEKALEEATQIEREDVLELCKSSPEIISPELLDKLQQKAAPLTLNDCKKITRYSKRSQVDVQEQIDSLKIYAILRDQDMSKEAIIDAILENPFLIESPLLTKLEEQGRSLSVKDINEYRSEWGDEDNLQKLQGKVAERKMLAEAQLAVGNIKNLVVSKEEITPASMEDAVRELRTKQTQSTPTSPVKPLKREPSIKR